MEIQASTERVYEAVKWVSQRRHANRNADTLGLVEAAAARFNLSSSQKEWLLGSLASTPR